MMKQQYILNEQGKALFVVIPVEEYNQLQEYKSLVTTDDDSDEGWGAIEVEEGDNDNETIPHEVVSLSIENDISLLGAWRIYRGLSQSEVANKTGLTQSAISQMENKGSKPQMKTLERLAKVYNCRPSQLYI